jgi:5-methylcytosine-specific restriction endonuclease McrA
MHEKPPPAVPQATPLPGHSSLTDATLVLNRSWLPVGVTTVQNAICMCAREVARIVLPGSYELFDLDQWMQRPPAQGAAVVRSVHAVFQAPEILHLVGYDKVPRHEAAFSKRNIYIRDRATCQYCGNTPGWSRLTIDHIVPRSRGGTNSWENCVVACKPCNNRKGNRTPKEAGLMLSRPPRRPPWRSFLHGVRSKDSWQAFVQLDLEDLEWLMEEDVRRGHRHSGGQR